MPRESSKNRRRPGRPVAVPGETPTREKVLQAAIDLFADTGYAGTPVRSIARRAGITEAAVYRHYPNKEALLLSILKLVEEGLYTPLPGEEDFGSPGGPSVFSGLLMPLPDLIASDPQVAKLTRIVHGELMHNDAIRLFYREQFVRRAEDYTEALIRRAVGRGTVRRCNTRALARMLNAYRSNWTYRTVVLHPEGLGDLDAARRQLAEQVRFFEDQFLVDNAETEDRT